MRWYLLPVDGGFPAAGCIGSGLRAIGMGTCRLGAEDESHCSSGDLAGIDTDSGVWLATSKLLKRSFGECCCCCSGWCILAGAVSAGGECDRPAIMDNGFVSSGPFN